MTLNDLRPQLAAAYEQSAAVSAPVRPEQAEDRTPCTKMNVAELLDHLVFAARRAAALGHGEAPAFEGAAPHIDMADVPDALRSAGADASAGWGDEASLERVITMPWGEEYPGRALVGIYLVELTTHAWDLAFATGNQHLLDGDLGTSALACAQASIKPEYRSEEGEPFGPEVPAPADATDWERLAAFMGRAPR